MYLTFIIHRHILPCAEESGKGGVDELGKWAWLWFSGSKNSKEI